MSQCHINPPPHNKILSNASILVTSWQSCSQLRKLAWCWCCGRIMRWRWKDRCQFREIEKTCEVNTQPGACWRWGEWSCCCHYQMWSSLACHDSLSCPPSPHCTAALHVLQVTSLASLSASPSFSLHWTAQCADTGDVFSPRSGGWLRSWEHLREGAVSQSGRPGSSTLPNFSHHNSLRPELLLLPVSRPASQSTG